MNGADSAVRFASLRFGSLRFASVCSVNGVLVIQSWTTGGGVHCHISNTMLDIWQCGNMATVCYMAND